MSDKRVVLYVGDNEESEAMAQEVKKLERVGFTIRVWHWRNLGHQPTDPPHCYITNSGEWAGPILRVENVKRIVAMELSAN